MVVQAVQPSKEVHRAVTAAYCSEQTVITEGDSGVTSDLLSSGRWRPDSKRTMSRETLVRKPETLKAKRTRGEK